MTPDELIQLRLLVGDRAFLVILGFMPRYGEIGTLIGGSTLLRGYCGTCGEPIRLTKADIEEKMGIGHCSNCRAAAHPGQGSSGYNKSSDEDGSWSNVVMESEE